MALSSHVPGQSKRSYFSSLSCVGCVCINFLAIVRVGLTILTIFWLSWMGVFGQEVEHSLPGISPPQIVNGTIVFKLSPQAEGYSKNVFRLEDLPFEAKSVTPIKNFPSFQKSGQPSVLQGIFKVKVDPDEDITDLCKILSGMLDIAYAEPVFVDQLLYVPSDPEANASEGAQGYLRVINAYEAWDQTRGSEEVIIGVIDTGADLDHEDLQDNFYINESEEINGLDDDDNGYIDDRIGYDFADDDHDVQSDGSAHGSRVTGLSGAKTDNGIGIAGLGFNSKVVPLKGFSTATNESSGNYQAIIYAADNGYDVINLSWGSVNTFSQFNQDIIDYAVLEHDVVVVAAAGNGNEEVDFYPASYDHVLSVAATKLDDTKSAFATFGNKVDVSAPGSAIYTTNNDSYGHYWGSSFASPIVAGVAGLVRAQFPDLNAEQVMERIRVTADDIYDLNPDYIGKLGKGRLNAYRAVSESNLKSVRLDNYMLRGQNEAFYFGDSLFLTLEFKNYLDPIESGLFWITDLNNDLRSLSDSISFGALGTFENYTTSTLTAIISESATPGSTIDLRVNLADGSYQDFQQLTIPIAPDYLDIRENQAFLTVAGNGDLGKVNSGESGSGLGIGTESVASEIGLILSTNKDSVIDNAPVAFGVSKNADFRSELSIKPYSGTNASLYARNIFNDRGKLGLKVEQASLSWEELDSALVVSYRVINAGKTSIDSLGVSLFVNWDIKDHKANRATWDKKNTAYAYDADSTILSGYRIVSNGSIYHAALDISDENGHVKDVQSTFTDSLKYEYSIQVLDSAGFLSQGNDVAQMLSSLERNLAVGQSREVVYLFAFARNLKQLDTKLDALEAQYKLLQETPPSIGSEVSCAGGMIEINPSGGTRFNFYSNAARTDTLGIGESILFGPVSRDTVIYLTSADSIYEGSLRRLDIHLLEEFVNFESSTSVVYLGENDNLVSFTDKSFNPTSWQWDFGNGVKATVQNPTVVYSEPGIYTVTLKVETKEGCSGTMTGIIEVVNRPDPLSIESIEVCYGDHATIAADEGKTVRVFADHDDETAIFQGSEWEFRFVTSDTIVFVAQVEDGHESTRNPIVIEVREVLPEYDLVSALDSLTLDDLWLINRTPFASKVDWIINGEILMGDTVVYPLDQQQLDVTLNVTDDFGCSGSIRDILTLDPAALPTYASTEVICRGDNVTISPGNGSYFGFFDTDNPESNLFKGQSLTLDSLTKEIHLGIFGLDGGIPGDTLRVTITPNAFDFEILANPDSLFLDQDRSVSFSLDTLVHDPLWYVNDQLIERIATPILSFDSAAVYKVKAVGSDSDGCVHTEIRDFLVFDMEPVVLNATAIAPFSIYPNPVEDVVYIDGLASFTHVSIVSLDGTIVSKIQSLRGNQALDVSHLSPGVYLIQLVDSDRAIVRKFIKK